MKRVITFCILLFSASVFAQSSGTPSQIRVKVDANNYLILVAAAQTAPISNPTVFSNIRLKTDANNNLQVVLTGTITPTFPLAAPIGCTTIPYSFVGRTTTGLCSSAANTWNLYGNNVNSLLGTDTLIDALVPVLVGAIGTPLTKLEVTDTSTSIPRGITNSQYSTTADSARFNLYKARGTRGTPTTIVTADVLGRLSSFGYDGSNFIESASISMHSNGTIGASRVPSQIIFQTSTDANPSVLSTAFTISNSQTSTFNHGVGVGITAPTEGIYSSSVAIDSSITAIAGTPRIAVASDTSASVNAAYIAYNNVANGPSLQGYKTRASSTAPTTIVSSGDALMAFTGRGADGSNYIVGGSLALQVDGSPGLNSMPGRWIFSTTPSGSSTATERLRIDSAGLLTATGTLNVTSGYQLNGATVTPASICSNTAASTTITTTSTKTYFNLNCKISANRLAAGSIITISGRGVYNGNVTDTLVLTLDACQISGCGSGTVVNLATTGTLTLAAVSNQGWELNENTNTFTIGSSGTLDTQGKAFFETAATVTTIAWTPNTATATVNTTVDEYLSISAQFSSNNASNAITLRNLQISIQ